jgi:hypothetical protein
VHYRLGHFIGLPDLYDTDKDDPGVGLGAYVSHSTYLRLKKVLKY